LSLRQVGGSFGKVRVMKVRVMEFSPNCTVNVLVLWGLAIEQLYNFDETWVSLWYLGTKKNES